ncbi:hypothetical protein LP415_21260 [Polaromonas sp. P1(28)-8]|nr:hypothetical protein LP415_21260 [Polaromonas sp. P1(28)-8]
MAWIASREGCAGQVVAGIKHPGPRREQFFVHALVMFHFGNPGFQGLHARVKPGQFRRVHTTDQANQRLQPCLPWEVRRRHRLLLNGLQQLLHAMAHIA